MLIENLGFVFCRNTVCSFFFYIGRNKGKIRYNSISMNADNTIKGMEQCVIPFYREQLQKENIAFELEGDNARAHVSSKFQSFISDQQVHHTAWGGSPINTKGGKAPNSPDLCPIEYLFNDWSNNVYKRSPNSVFELKKIAQEEWSKLRVDEVEKKYKHMQKVYKWVVDHNGNEYGKV